MFGGNNYYCYKYLSFESVVSEIENTFLICTDVLKTLDSTCCFIEIVHQFIYKTNYAKEV